MIYYNQLNATIIYSYIQLAIDKARFDSGFDIRYRKGFMLYAPQWILDALPQHHQYTTATFVSTNLGEIDYFKLVGIDCKLSYENKIIITNPNLFYNRKHILTSIDLDVLIDKQTDYSQTYLLVNASRLYDLQPK